jgi:aminopeptidase N
MRLTACLILLVASTASAQEVPEYRELRAARPDGRTIPVKALTLERDAYRIELRSGVVHLLAPVGGETFGAVFVGEGSYQLTPATVAELRHLQLVTGDNRLEALTDRFTRLMLFFTDKTLAELSAHAPIATGSPDAAATGAFEDYLERQRERIQPNLHIRILADLLNRPGRSDGVFLGAVNGQSRGEAIMAVDPLGISNLAPRFGFYGGEEVAHISLDSENGGFWYASTYAPKAIGGRGKPNRPLAEATHYEIDTTFEGTGLRGSTTITLTPLVDNLRVVPLHIFVKMRIRSAAIVGGEAPVPAGVIHDEAVTGWLSRLFADELSDGDAAAVFAKPLTRGVPVRLKLEYDGSDVLSGRGGRYSVRARESWYPNLGTFSDVATYEMTFNFPSRNELVAVGELVSERTEGGRKIATWRSASPIRVAGFNYGEFRKRSQQDAESGVGVDVYTDQNSTSMAASALADATNTSRAGKSYFGDPPFKRLSITQQVELNFGQSWPSLVFLPTAALLDQATLVMGLESQLDARSAASFKDFVNTVGWHEVAHQWWGHQVGWESYRDQWLSEGFAEFTAALMLELVSGKRAADRFWELRRTEIFGTDQEVAFINAGPITQGQRLSTKRSPGAASAMLYSKGAYVLHMLRTMMRGGGPDPDRAFKAMMRDFVSSWSGKNPSTTDFMTVAERHMTPAMNLAGNGKLVYFFDQWVHGTAIPAITSSITATEVGGRRFRLEGTVTQAGVPADFRTLVPIYVDLGNDRIEKIGTVTLTGSTAQKVSAELELPQRPRRVLANAMHDVLSR